MSRAPTVVAGVAVALATAGLFSHSEAAAVPTPSFDQAEEGYVADVPPGMAIDVISTSEECDSDTVAVAIAEDSSAFTIAYSDFVAVVGPGTGPTDFRAYCRLDLAVSPPPGFTYAVTSVDYRVYVRLEEGATGIHRNDHSFWDEDTTNPFTQVFTGPMDEYWAVTDTLALGPIWAPCDQVDLARIATELRVDAGTSDPETTSLIALSGPDEHIETTYHLAWRQC